MKASYNTGRDYGTAQVLDIDYTPFAGTVWDDDACDRVVVEMKDAARGLDYKLIVLRSDCTAREIGRATLYSYDDNIQAPWDSKVGDKISGF